MIQLTEQNRIDLITWLRAGATGRVLKALENLNHVEQEPVAWTNETGTIAWSKQDMMTFDDEIRSRTSK